MMASLSLEKTNSHEKVNVKYLNDVISAINDNLSTVYVTENIYKNFGSRQYWVRKWSNGYAEIRIKNTEFNVDGTIYFFGGYLSSDLGFTLQYTQDPNNTTANPVIVETGGLTNNIFSHVKYVEFDGNCYQCYVGWAIDDEEHRTSGSPFVNVLIIGKIA